MNRTYEISKTKNGWELVIWENGDVFARGVAGRTEEDFAFLLEQAKSICGIDEGFTQPLADLMLPGRL